MRDFLKRIFNKSKTAPPLKKEEIEEIYELSQLKDKIIGIVEIYKDDDFIERGKNLVVYDGREYVASKIFDLGDFTNYKITHFGIGSGGTSSDGVTLLGAQDSDTDLYKPLTLNSNDSSYLRNGILKPINSKELIIDDNTNKYTCGLFTLTVRVADEPDLQAPVKVNEAALFSTYGKNWKIFSHYCTTDKILRENESITFKWYIFT